MPANSQKEKRRNQGFMLHRMRTVFGLRQLDVADALGVSQTTYSEWERGVTRIPDVIAVAQAILDQARHRRKIS